MRLQKSQVLRSQESNSGIEPSDVVVETHRKVSSDLVDVPVLEEDEGSSLLLGQVDLVDTAFLRDHLHLRDVALNFRSIEAAESGRDVQSGHWGVEQSEAFVGV